ncbi:VW5B2 protein, partial [Amia calva]|nr:VW5B2 protein [Amia calva]
LLLKASCIKSCANGCSLGITAHLTYVNHDSQPVEGVFVYPLGETEIVVGFEAVISGRMLSVQIQSRAKAEDCCLDCCTASSGVETQCSNGKDEIDCQTVISGHLILDEDLERTTFIIGTGVIGPMDIVTVIINTTLEPPTLENGAIRLVFPVVFTPLVTGRVAQSKSEIGGRCEENSPTSCFGATHGKQDKAPGAAQQCARAIFTSQASNPLPYELNFELLVRGACLLAGLESPTHALRADADPSAHSASATYITLAEEHLYDRHLEILLHLCEPHSPHVLLEKGRLSFKEYEHHVCSRRDFVRCAKKEAETEKRLEFVRKRFHKDILCNPVLMLNFCPDLQSDPAELQQVTRELLFLMDCSGSVSAANLDKIKVSTCPPTGTRTSHTQIIVLPLGGREILKYVFHTLSLACEFIYKMRASMGGTNLLGALSWVYQQPAHRAYPRQLFIITDGTVSSLGRVIELVRRHASSARCFGLGLGALACRRLLCGVAGVTGGSAEFCGEEERLQPKLIKSLKKALEPVLTDVHIDWYVPDNMEALLSPNEIGPLYPGSRLIGYCTLYDVSAFRSRKAGVKGRLPKGLSQGSVCSVFGQSQDELSSPSTTEIYPNPSAPLEHYDVEEALREISREISSEFPCARPVDAVTGEELETSSDVRQRILQASYVQDQYMLTRCSISSERGLPHGSSSTDSPGGHDLSVETGSLPQGLEKVSQQEHRGLSRWERSWKQTPLPQQTEALAAKAGAVSGSEESCRTQRALARSAMSSRSFSSPQGDLDMHRLRRALEKVSFDQTLGRRLEESDGETQPTLQGAFSRRSLANSIPLGNLDCQMFPSAHILDSLLFPASPLDWDSFTDPEYLFAAVPLEKTPSATPAPPAQCRSVIHGLLAGKPVSWEVSVPLDDLLAQQMPGDRNNSWGEMVHQLTARSVIRDFEHMAEKELDIENGQAKRYRLKAIQTSKACKIICMYTAFAAVDTNTNEGLSGSVEVRNTGMRPGSHRSSQSGSRRLRTYSAGLGHRPSSRDSEEFDDTFVTTEREDSPASPCSVTSWESTRLPCVRLQLASGAFLLSDLYSECVQIPLERLRRASPFTTHRSSLSPPYRCTSPHAKPAAHRAHEGEPRMAGVELRASLGSFSEVGPFIAMPDLLSSEGVSPEIGGGLQQADSGRGSETDLPEGVDMAGLKGAARQLFLLLRHWDENIKLNMLCYNPNNV